MFIRGALYLWATVNFSLDLELALLSFLLKFFLFLSFFFRFSLSFFLFLSLSLSFFLSFSFSSRLHTYLCNSLLYVLASFSDTVKPVYHVCTVTIAFLYLDSHGWLSLGGGLLMQVHVKSKSPFGQILVPGLTKNC